MKYSGKKKVKNITIEAAAAEPAGKVVDLATLNANYIALNGDTLSGTLGANVKISIADGATVMLDGVSINANGTWTSGNYAGITCLGNATIILKDGTTNAIRGFNKEYPGIFAAVNHQLTIKGGAAGTGSLNTSSNGSAAGIGGGYRPGLSCGSIEIQGGVITATGGQLAAGIGSGWYSNCGNIYISGGTVSATAGEWSAGIGSGAFKSSCGTITITSGVTSVTVKKNDDMTRKASPWNCRNLSLPVKSWRTTKRWPTTTSRRRHGNHGGKRAARLLRADDWPRRRQPQL